jgi:uncharacterized Zn finger protein (UPF0148 family)
MLTATSIKMDELYRCPGCGNWWFETETILKDGRLGCGVCEQKKENTNDD